MILLDTNALIWALTGSRRLGPGASELLASRHPAHYSSVSVEEMMIKSLSGRLEVPEGICERLDALGLRQLPFVGEHAEAFTAFPELVGHDPFDRALLAQAEVEGLTFLTADRRILALGKPWIVDAAN